MIEAWSCAKDIGSRQNGLPVECQPSQNARRLVNIIKSSVSKLFKSGTIRHIAMSVVMTYVHNYYIVHNYTSTRINVLEGITWGRTEPGAAN